MVIILDPRIEAILCAGVISIKQVPRTIIHGDMEIQADQSLHRLVNISCARSDNIKIIPAYRSHFIHGGNLHQTSAQLFIEIQADQSLQRLVNISYARSDNNNIIPEYRSHSIRGGKPYQKSSAHNYSWRCRQIKVCKD